MIKFSREEMVKAMLTGDESCDGSFYTAVKTTKIYCHPSCKGKKPLPQNVVFFESPREAENNGFRPCKKCFPNLPIGKWVDHKDTLELLPPAEFNFDECLVFLGRSEQESLHKIHDKVFYKLIDIDNEPVLLKVWNSSGKIMIAFPLNKLRKPKRASAAEYVWKLFDLERDLNPFYQLAERDSVLGKLTEQYFGLRIIGIPDLFEALTWAVMGQQINLAFAYTLKKRWVETFGKTICFESETFWLYPSYETISKLDVADLTVLQFTTRKAEYVIGIAKLMASGALSKTELLSVSKSEARVRLLKIRGVGEWTADYVLMKCLGDMSALPAADIGLQNALRIQLGLDKKPTKTEIEKLAENWVGWEGYATFYLWRSLYV